MAVFGTPRVELNTSVNSGNYTSRSLDDIFCVMGETQFGLSDTPTLISNTTEYKDKFGAFTTPFSLMCKRALEGGVKLRISKIGLRDNAWVEQGTYAYETFQVSGVTDCIIAAKYVGTWGNNVTIQKLPGTTSSTWTIRVSVDGIGFQLMQYKKSPTAADLAALNAESKWVVFVEFYAAILASAYFSAYAIYRLYGGTNYSSPNYNVLYAGNQATQTGVYAFDKTSEVKWIACDRSVNAIDLALNEYATKRNAIHLLRTPTGITGTAAIDYRNAAGSYSGTKIQSYRTWGVFGGVSINSNGVPTVINSLADVFISISNKNKFGKRHQSYAIWDYSKLSNVLGVDYNLAIESRVTESNDVFNSGLNAVVEENGEIRHLGDNTFDTTEKSPFQYCGNVETLQDLIVKIKPIYRRYIHKANTPDEWRLMYNEIKSLLEGYITEGAIKAFDYQGDQDAVKESEYVINKIEDVNDGKYKAIINIQFAPTMRFIEINLSGTLSTVNVEVAVV